MADLCSGTGAATMPFVEHLHQVDRFDLPDGDITKLHFTEGQYDFIWASPPCPSYSRLAMPWYPITEVDLGLWEHCRRLIEEAGPRYHIIENVRGAQRIWGPPAVRCGSFMLWGSMPAWPTGCYRKHIDHIRNPRERAQVPRALALQVRDIIERECGDI